MPDQFSKQDENFMSMAIEKAKSGVIKGQTPFGACIVKQGKVISCAHNEVWRKTDITAHAEIQAIRLACGKNGSVNLSGCTIYSTCEPCPMCFSACHWARISKIIYGANIKDAKIAGFNELAASNKKLITLTKSPLKVKCGCLRSENKELFLLWKKLGLNQAY